MCVFCTVQRYRYPMSLNVKENELRLTYADGKIQTATHFA